MNVLVVVIFNGLIQNILPGNEDYVAKQRQTAGKHADLDAIKPFSKCRSSISKHCSAKNSRQALFCTTSRCLRNAVEQGG